MTAASLLEHGDVTGNTKACWHGGVDGITDDLKYALVAGAVTGGGLSVIANAPNPAGDARTP